MRELEPTDDLFPGFRLADVPTTSGSIRARVGGEGPPLLLLHGYPQTHHLWHKVANRLVERFTLVCADLPGYGASYRPPVTPDHEGHSKRAMATALVEAMRRLGYERWMVGAHDRGARVAHRMALDHGDRVIRFALLDIAPTREMYRHTTEAFARAYWHWFFLIQPAPLPETMIAADPDGFWRTKCGERGLDIFDSRALDAYLEAFRDPAVIAASCEDYRAAATIDLRHDDEDGGRKVTQPLLALWGEFGVVERCFDVLALWRERAEDVRGRPVPAGHYLAEECPDDVAAAFADFFASSDQA
ncbi:alpha/beta fold hydrolase [Rubellimicrobium arenae]|uniref:alpha/beta fold hydrolase n=1 Tax=Rubellimicrobium arenae TaxID=2817372 RepID=UPI001B3017AC|nr:alpha/beta hydrolase [Rubellimicrobium arenae]